MERTITSEERDSYRACVIQNFCSLRSSASTRSRTFHFFIAKKKKINFLTLDMQAGLGWAGDCTLETV